MSKLAFYRYYRPRRFSDVIGQQHIVSTLRNQVKNGHISHAYLLCGTRGTGKTSTAQILARAVNCLTPEDGEPCGHCSICALASNPDVWEIDAASNNGVDQIRDLRDKVRFAPLESRYKVYIIDEVHMLSDGAFNALLKTLEEPPPHAIFILATTEPQKLPATILSRCQRFDFHRIESDSIVQYMADVLKDQSITYEDAALRKIALLADGGMRDALSMLDQCVAFAGDNLDNAKVLDILGNVDDSLLHELSQAIFTGHGNLVLSIVANAMQGGRDVAVLARDLMAYLRSLLLVRVSGPSAEVQLQLTPEEFEQRHELANATDIALLLEACDILAKLDGQLRRATQPRLLLETALLRLCFRDTLAIPATPATAAKTANAIADIPPPLAKEVPPPAGLFAPTTPPSVLREKEESKAASVSQTVEPVAQESIKTVALRESNSGVQAVFDALVSKQGAGIQPIFKMYKWQYQLNGNMLELVAPGDCLPALLQTLKSNVENFSAALQEQYPGIQVRFVESLSAEVAASDFSPPPDVVRGNSLSDDNTETGDTDLYSAAVELFGSDVVVRKE